MPPKLLLVDDSFSARRGMRSRLPAGIELEVSEAANGKEALDSYRESRADLVLLDLTMPVMDGFEVLKLLKAIDPAAKVIVCTADTQHETRRRCLDAGATDLINKPLTREMLERVIREYL